MRSRQHRGGRRPLEIDPGFAEAFSEYGGGSGRRHAEHKAQQLCRQVQRALNLALGDAPVMPSAGETLDLFVDEVTPAPDCGHLLVHIVIPPGQAVGEVLRALREDAPRLRAQVAGAITRKRAPELSFVPRMPEDAGEGGLDE